MAAPRTGDRRGLALLEVLVALVVLSLVVVGFLRLHQGGHRLLGGSADWSAAVALATDGMERAKLEPATPRDAVEELADGFRRTTSVGAPENGLALLTVTVETPDGARFALHRLAPAPGGAR